MRHGIAALGLLTGWLVLLATGARAATPAFQDRDVVCFVGDATTHSGLYHSYVRLFYATRYPEMRLRFWNAGLLGSGVQDSAGRFGWDVTDRRPTVVALLFGMSELGPTYADPEALAPRFRDASRHFTALADAARAAGARLIFVAPPFYDETVRADRPAERGRGRALLTWTKRLSVLAPRYDAGFVDGYATAAGLTAERQKTDPAFTLAATDRAQPSPVGHFVIAYAFLKAQGFGPYVSRIELDARRPAAGEQVNCMVRNPRGDGRSLSFDCQEASLPFPVPEQAKPALAVVPFTRELNQQVLAVHGLETGSYDLRIDGEFVGQYSAVELGRGVNLAENAKTPQHRQAAELARANAKRHDTEVNALRTFAYVRHRVLDRAKGKPVKSADYETYLGDWVKRGVGSERDRAMVERFLSLWPQREAKEREHEQAVADLQRHGVLKEHHYELVRSAGR